VGDVDGEVNTDADVDIDAEANIQCWIGACTHASRVLDTQSKE
jgi:hypothetical protein